jgi:hypothetical protein
VSFGVTSADVIESAVSSAKIKLSPLFVMYNINGDYETVDFGAYDYVDWSTPGHLYYDQAGKSTVFANYTEVINSFGAIAATESADLSLGNIIFTSFGGFTGTSTIDITGYANSNDTLVRNVMFVFHNPSGNTPPTITFTAKGSAGAVSFSDETGVPVFGATSQTVMVPFVYLQNNNKWYGGSQLTFDL